MAQTRNFSVLIMADSRGAGLEKRIRDGIKKDHPEKADYLNVTVRTLGGATTNNIIKKMDERFSKSDKYDMIFVFVGINDFTTKVYAGTVEPNFDNIPDMVESLTDRYTNLK